MVDFAGGFGGLSGSHGFHFPPFFPLVPYRLLALEFAGLPQIRHWVAWAPFQQPGYLLDLKGSLAPQGEQHLENGPGGRRGPTME